MPTRSAWVESTLLMAIEPALSISAWVFKISLASPSQQATRQLSDIYSSSEKKSRASIAFFSNVFSPSTISLQKTSLGYQPVLALICLNASAIVLPRLTSSTVWVALPCLDDSGTAICEVRINVSSSLSTPTASTIAVFCTSSIP